MKALLIGSSPDLDLGYCYVTQPPYDAVVIGSLTLSELLYFSQAEALEALAQGKTVVLYTPGMPDAPKNRAMAASIAGARRQLKNWGVVFSDGQHRHLVTAQEAKAMKAAGGKPAPGAVLTPLAKEILEQ